jgi:hypothetical protein
MAPLGRDRGLGIDRGLLGIALDVGHGKSPLRLVVDYE